ncbi:hypothetical protein ACMFMF_010811 [Clarireedia jacksonii]
MTESSQGRIRVQDSHRVTKKGAGVRARVRTRALQACQPCAVAKTRCDNGRPCARCTRRSLTCVRDFDIREPSLSLHDNLLDRPDRLVSGYFDNESTLLNHSQQLETPLSIWDHNAIASNSTELTGSNNIESTTGTTSTREAFQFTLQDAEFLSSFPEVFLGINETGQQYTAPAAEVAKSQSYAADRWEQDFWWDTDPKPLKPQTIRADAPCAAMQLDSLEASTDITLAPNPLTFDLAVRDSLLALAVDACGPEIRSVIVSAFPSCSGLESLTKSFLNWHQAQEDTFIHIPTFSAAETGRELLMAVVVGGALRSSSPAAQRLGLSLHEVLGNQLRKIIGRSESSSRQLQYLQAYALVNDFGLWSGNKRKIELASGGNGNLLSILRGTGCYRRSSYSLRFSATMSAQPLENRWRRWVEAESYKRLVFHVFIHSNQESMMTFGTPPLSYFELTLPLPASRGPWLATSDSSWQELVGEHQCRENVTVLSITDCLADLSRLSQLTDIYDQAISKTLLLYALAPMIQSYRHLHMAPSWSGESLSRGDDFADNIHYHWLLRPFENLKNVFEIHETETGSQSMTEILMDTLHLHLHTPVNHLELLMGGEDKYEAQACHTIVQRWAESRMARQSIWYAGQLLGKIRVLGAKHMTDFHCVIVYQSLLCLWAYGQANKSGQVDLVIDNDLPGNTPEVVPIALDLEECVTTKKWIIFGRGQPVISIGYEETPLERHRQCPLSSMDILGRHFIDIIKSKHKPRTVLPLTAEHVCILIRNLCSKY